jgi:hypothetical protein
MPSSLIFTGLVVVWLLILVPAVARHQQEVTRLSDASLAGRVLTRPGRRNERRGERRGGHPSEEGDSVDDDAQAVGTRTTEVWVPAARRARDEDTTVTVPSQPHGDGGSEADEDPHAAADTPGSADPADDAPADDADGWERPAPRYRPGRGGFDPHADAETARRRYAFRQRVVLALLIFALLTAVVAAAAVRMVWWAHGAIDLILVSYLVYLRRQVREEAAIRERRTQRRAGTRRTPAADDRDLDEWARRGREVTRRPAPVDERPDEPVADAAEPEKAEPPADAELVDELSDDLEEDGDTTRVRGVGEPVGLLPARRRGTADDVAAEPESALPRLCPAPPPPLPPGTSLVVVDDDELDLHDLGASAQPHRRAVGQ